MTKCMFNVLSSIFLAALLGCSNSTTGTDVPPAKNEDAQESREPAKDNNHEVPTPPERAKPVLPAPPVTDTWSLVSEIDQGKLFYNGFKQAVIFVPKRVRLGMHLWLPYPWLDLVRDFGKYTLTEGCVKTKKTTRRRYDFLMKYDGTKYIDGLYDSAAGNFSFTLEHRASNEVINSEIRRLGLKVVNVEPSKLAFSYLVEPDFTMFTTNSDPHAKSTFLARMSQVNYGSKALGITLAEMCELLDSTNKFLFTNGVVNAASEVNVYEF